jgi:hypothetical protein
VYVIGFVLESEMLFYASHMMRRLFRVLVVCSIWEEKKKEVLARIGIYILKFL